ncbi:MAG TPA: hypothetical protein PLZ21_00040 [Armatimonadota bacterium]|nr:hypothetical protein [Armatimonadota bacterium]HOP78935.1 hypothetical protein [Armatimonadota bacterium]
MRKTIGNNPLDVVIPASDTQSQVIETPGSTQQPAPRPSGRKERLTVHLPVDLIERAKNAVYWTPGLTLAGLAEQAFTEALERLEQKRGEPFPNRTEELRGGRPVK